MNDNFEKEPEVVSAINEGRVVDAIKKLRASRGIGLKEAKDLVDSYVDAHDIPGYRRRGSGSNMFWIVVFALILVGYYLFKNS